MTIKQTLNAYYLLTKPGIVYGNALTATAGYLFASGLSGSWVTFVSMLAGVMSVMASACVYNNIIDRDIDRKMSRTQDRPSVTGKIGPGQAFVFGGTLLVVGVLLLAYGTNITTLAVALWGFVAYVGLYTYAKRVTVHSTLIGTLSGATPPVIGYVAATGALDVTAGLLYLVLITWQMPHFYVISIFRRDDYKRADIPVLSVARGVEATKQQIVAYTALFVLACVLLGFYGGLNLLGTLVITLAGAYWLYTSLLPVVDSSKWALGMFHRSLAVLLIVCLSLGLNGVLG
jgi:protoheme IX farnesyltransferase